MPIAHALFGTDPLDPAKMYDEYAAAAEQVRPFVADTGRMLNRIIAEGGSVMFEGAQGNDAGHRPLVPIRLSRRLQLRPAARPPEAAWDRPLSEP